MRLIHPAVQSYLGIPGYVFVWVIFVSALFLFAYILRRRYLLISLGETDHTRIKPGELEKPIVRKSSPTSALVCGSGSSFVPIR